MEIISGTIAQSYQAFWLHFYTHPNIIKSIMPLWTSWPAGLWRHLSERSVWEEDQRCSDCWGIFDLNAFRYWLNMNIVTHEVRGLSFPISPVWRVSVPCVSNVSPVQHLVENLPWCSAITRLSQWNFLIVPLHLKPQLAICNPQAYAIS